MFRTPGMRSALAVAILLAATGGALAKGTAEEIGKLGKQLTCVGAEKAGSPGGVAEYTGKWLGPAPGMVAEPGKHPGDPYAAEKPLFTITAQNVAQYADKLSEGQKAMFRKYPASFRMAVYPSHRDFRYDDSVCKAVESNAAEAELAADGLTVANGHMGAVPFPFPRSGLELLWNASMPAMTHTEFRDADAAVVYPNNSILWGQSLVWTLSRANDPKLRGKKYEGVAAYAKGVTLLPEREKGVATRIIDNFTMDKDARLAWQYIPSTRRIRQAPGFGFDMPNPTAANTITIDDTRIFNGSGERYHWKIVGRKEIYIPYNNYRLESKAVGENKYARLLTPNHENPELVRWELHRVWILEARLKEGYRHLYPQRVFYLDEDSWLFTMADSFDAQGVLWKFNWINNIYQPGANVFNPLSAYYHDLNAGHYTVYDLTQAKAQGVVSNLPGAEYANPSFYSMDGLKASGY